MNRNRWLLASLLCAAGAWAGEPLSGRLDADADVAVEIANGRGSILVEAGARDAVEIDGSLGAGSRLVFDGDRRRVRVRIDSEAARGWSWWARRGPAEDTQLIVRVPRAASIDASAVSASVDVRGHEGSRVVEVGTVSGDVRVDGRSERLSLATVSGDVRARGGARRASVESVSGDIDVRDLGGDAELESVSGDIRADLAELGELRASSVSGDVAIAVERAVAPRLTVETMSGAITLRLPASVNARIEAQTFSGRISSEFGPVERTRQGGGSRLDTRAGAGDGRVRLESFSGDIRLARAPD